MATLLCSRNPGGSCVEVHSASEVSQVRDFVWEELSSEESVCMGSGDGEYDGSQIHDAPRGLLTLFIHLFRILSEAMIVGMIGSKEVSWLPA